MISKILSIISNNKKTVASIAAVVGLGVSLYQLHGHVYDSGRESMRVELVAKHNKALEDARKEYEQSIKKSIERIQADHLDELIRVKNEQEIIERVKTVTKYVDKKIIVEPECDVLAADVVELLKQATSITSSAAKDN